MRYIQSYKSTSISTNPLEGIIGMLIFCSICIVSASVSVATCGQILMQYTIPSLQILQGFIITISLGWYAFALSENHLQYLKLIPVILVLSIPLLAMVFLEGVGYFWYSSLVLGLWIFYLNYKETNGKISWEFIILSIYSTWTVLGFLITLGDYFNLAFIINAIGISQLHQLLDILLFISAVFFLLMMSEALFKAFIAKTPNIPPLPQIIITAPHDGATGILAMLGRVFATLINALLIVIQSVTNIFWQLAALISAYIYRTGTNLANHFIRLIMDKPLWLRIIRIIASTLGIVGIAYINIWIAPILSGAISIPQVGPKPFPTSCVVDR